MNKHLVRKVIKTLIILILIGIALILVYIAFLFLYFEVFKGPI